MEHLLRTRSDQIRQMAEAMTPLRILYLGTQSGTSLDRAQALRRLCHTVDIIDPKALLPQRFKLGAILNKAIHEFGGLFCSPYVQRKLRNAIGGRRYDLVWVDGGDLISPSIIGMLKKSVAPSVLNYNVDDPYGPRDRRQWLCYLKSVPFYDLIVVVRQENVAEARMLGARRISRVYRSADEITHSPVILSQQERANFESEVLFVGTWMPERGKFMARLLELDVPLAIRGDRWSLAPEWKVLKAAWRSSNVYRREYAMAIQGAKINLGLLSKENRDLHTTRSLEIPSLGGLLCAERTSEHLKLYREGEEAVFWSTAEECAALCHSLLADEAARARIRQAGQRRCRQNQTYNEPTMRGVLEMVPGIVSKGDVLRPGSSDMGLAD